MSLKLTWGMLAGLAAIFCMGCANSNQVIRGQNPGPAPTTAGFYHGDRGIMTKIDTLARRPHYTQISQHPDSPEQRVEYLNHKGIPVDARGNYFPNCQNGACQAGCQGQCHGSCPLGHGLGCHGSCEEGCESDCHGSGCGQCCICRHLDHCVCRQLGGCLGTHVGAAGAHVHAGLDHVGAGVSQHLLNGYQYPTHVHSFSYYPPKDLRYPAPNTPAAVVQYPYYTVKGPDCFFAQ